MTGVAYGLLWAPSRGASTTAEVAPLATGGFYGLSQYTWWANEIGEEVPALSHVRTLPAEGQDGRRSRVGLQRFSLLGSRRHGPRNDEALDLVGALEDSGDRGIAHHALDWEVTGVTGFA